MSSPAVTAGQAADATGTLQIAARRGGRQHLLAAPRTAVTPLGNVRRAHRPVCGTAARRWRCTPSDLRPLCHRCLTWATRRRADLATPYLHATPEQVHAALEQVTDPAELHRLVHAICSRADLVHHVVVDASYGRRRLTAYVPAARDRCTYSKENRSR